jgi:hypothetical protein
LHEYDFYLVGAASSREYRIRIALHGPSRLEAAPTNLRIFRKKQWCRFSNKQSLLTTNETPRRKRTGYHKM